MSLLAAICALPIITGLTTHAGFKNAIPFGGPSQIQGDNKSEELKHFIQTVKAREKVLKESGVRYFERTCAVSDGRQIRAMFVEASFQEGGAEKWIRHKLQDPAPLDASKLNASLSDEDLSLLASLPITTIEIWDGFRHLALSPKRTDRWSGTLYEKRQQTARSGILRAGIFPEERWLSDFLNDLELEKTSTDTTPTRTEKSWYFVRPWKKKSEKIQRFRIITDPNRVEAILRFSTAIVPIATTDVTPFPVRNDPNLFVDDVVTSQQFFSGCWFPEVVTTWQSFADTVSTGVVKLGSRANESSNIRFSSRAVPPELGDDAALVWDELTRSMTQYGSAEALSKLAKSESSRRMDSTSLLTASKSGSLPSGNESTNSMSPVFYYISGAGIIVVLVVGIFIYSRKNR